MTLTSCLRIVTSDVKRCEKRRLGLLSVAAGGGGGVCYLGLPCVACHAVLVVVLHCSSPAIRY